MNKLRNYIKELLKNKVQVEENVYSDKKETIEKKDNLNIFIDFINKIYKDEDIAIFTFPFLENIDDFIIKPENIDLIKHAPPSRVLPKGGIEYQELINDPEFRKRWAPWDKKFRD